jgi:hypothetical protein
MRFVDTERVVPPWPSDRLQAVAYALLEDAFTQTVPEGRIHYHAAGVTVRVADQAPVITTPPDQTNEEATASG